MTNLTLSQEDRIEELSVEENLELIALTEPKKFTHTIKKTTSFNGNFTTNSKRKINRVAVLAQEKLLIKQC